MAPWSGGDWWFFNQRISYELSADGLNFSAGAGAGFEIAG